MARHWHARNFVFAETDSTQDSATIPRLKSPPLDSSPLSLWSCRSMKAETMPPKEQASAAPPAKASKKRKKGKSTPPASEEGAVPTVEQRLAKQVEYYFSNANLRRDGHLKKLLGPDAALQGWAALDHVASFSRAKDIVDEAMLAQTDATAEARLDVVRQALRKYSKDVELSEDATKVRRAKPFEDENDASVGARTVYVEPVGAEETHATLGLRFAACGKVRLIPKWRPSPGDAGRAREPTEERGRGRRIAARLCLCRV
jgi:hypothetical protein